MTSCSSAVATRSPLRIFKEFVQDGEVSLDLVINALRDSLRRELEIENVPLPKPYSLRISFDENKM